MNSESLFHTPLHDEHLALGGRMVPFAGFMMPVQYREGALKEYQAVRMGEGGLFDISHMGQVRIEGSQAEAFLQYVTSNDVTRLANGQVQYSALLNESGTFIDDITTYRFDDWRYYLCVNAANRYKDVSHLLSHAESFDVQISDESDATTLLALQGKKAQAMLQTMTDIDLDGIGYYHFAEGQLGGFDAMISRTGYTGEDGFELYLPNLAAVETWHALLAAGAAPIGLAARDMLRTEMGYALYGHEISEEVTPVESGLMWITRLDKGEFIGRDAVVARKKEGRKKVLIGLRLKDRGIPREHYPVVSDGKTVGEVTSGLFSPLAGAGVALAYVEPGCASEESLAVDIRGKSIPADRAKPPFVRSRVRK